MVIKLAGQSTLGNRFAGSLGTVKRLLALFFVTTLSLSACGQTTDYAAKVNGHVVSTKTLMDELHTITSNPRYVKVLNEQLGGQGIGTGLQPAGENTVNATYTAQLLFNRLLVSLIDQAAVNEHVTVTAAQTKAAEDSVRSDLADNALFDSLPISYRSYLVDRQAKLTAIMAERDTPEKEQAYYDTHKDAYTQYCVRHILVESQAEAAQLRKQIVDDGADFAAIAKAKSIDSQGEGSSASQGGALGCFNKSQLDQFIPVFRDAAIALNGTEVSQPVQSQYGFHLIQVTSKTEQSFADAKADISKQLGSASGFLTEQLKSAKVKVNPRFGDFKPADESQGVAASITPPRTNGPQPKQTTTSLDPSQYTQDPTQQQAPTQ